MSDAKTSSSKPDGAKSKKDKTDSSESTSKTKSGDGASKGGKSARESIGGVKEVHYGYFSNVRTEEYREGWDSIWGSDNTNKAKATAPAKRNTRARPTKPIRLSFDIDDLPEHLRNGLAEAARSKLRKSRVNYDRRDKAGAVDWQIECWVKRV